MFQARDYCEGNTRSHSELGSQAFCANGTVLRHGRVGHCQAKSQ